MLPAMNMHYLASLFTPRSVALFGASDRRESVGGIVLRNLLGSGYEGPVYPINPKRKTVQDRKAYASLSDLPEPPDLAAIEADVKLEVAAELDKTHPPELLRQRLRLLLETWPKRGREEIDAAVALVLADRVPVD